MGVQMEHMGMGRWSVTFSRDADVDLVDTIKYFGHVVITPQWVDSDAHSDAQMLALSKWTGIVYNFSFDEQKMTVGGPGLLAWLGDATRRGVLYENNRIIDEKNLSDTLTMTDDPYGLLRDNTGNYRSITAGTITDPTSGSSTYYGEHIYQTQREAIEQMLGMMSRIMTAALSTDTILEYEINPDGTMDVGEEGDLFTTSPTMIVARTISGEPFLEPVYPQKLEAQKDATEFTSRVIVISQGLTTSQIAVAAAGFNWSGVDLTWPTNAERKDLSGTNIIRAWTVSEPLVTVAGARDSAKRHARELGVTAEGMKLSMPSYRLGSFVPGDYVYLWDPATGHTDTTNEVLWEGQVINPAKRRILSLRYEITDEMGVYYRDDDGVYTDLTPAVQPERYVAEAVGVKEA